MGVPCSHAPEWRHLAHVAMFRVCRDVPMAPSSRRHEGPSPPDPEGQGRADGCSGWLHRSFGRGWHCWGGGLCSGEARVWGTKQPSTVGLPQSPHYSPTEQDAPKQAQSGGQGPCEPHSETVSSALLFLCL